MGDRKRVLYLIAIMVAIAALVGGKSGTVIGLDYRGVESRSTLTDITARKLAEDRVPF